jgi:Ca-activated chloride channel family protein
LLHVLALASLILALSRPVERREVPRRSSGLDVVLVLDVSSSMKATDMDPDATRLGVARRAAKRFLARRPDDRIGLVTFARYPDLTCPLTRDHGALVVLLDQVVLKDPKSEEDATGIGTALARAAQVLTASQRSRAIVLLTDGEENVATAGTPREIAPLHAAQLCRDLGIRAYTIVAGSGRRALDGSWQPLDTRQMEEVAARTDGRFFSAPDAESMNAVYAEIDRLERLPDPEPRYEVVERYVLPLLLGLALLGLAVLLERTVLEVSP